MTRTPSAVWLCLSLLALLAPLLASCGGGDDAAGCDDAAGRLSRAVAGDVVTLGACRVTEALVVPAGVTVRGAGSDSTVIAPTSSGPAITLMPGGELPTTLTSLSVEGTQSTAILASGAGSVAIQDVAVAPARGLAIGIVDLTAAELSNVTLRGPVDAANAGDYPLFPDATMHAIVGLAVYRSTGVRLQNVVVRGFASNGAYFVDSDVDWQSGGAPENLFNGIFAAGGALVASELDVCGTLKGRLEGGTYGVVLTSGASVETSGLRACRTEGIGLLHDAVTARHEGLDSSDNEDVGVQVQRSTGVEILAAARLLSNGVAGLVVLDSQNVLVSDALVERTDLVPRIVGLGSAEQIGDGIQIVRTDASAPPLSTQVAATTLAHNGRAGVLIDAADGPLDGVTLEGVSVDGEGEQLGVIAQRASVTPAGWDDGVARSGVTAMNDAAFDSVLAVVQIVDPPMAPPAL